MINLLKKLTVLMLGFSMSTTVVCAVDVNGENQDETIWIRPIQKDYEHQQNNKTYKFYKDEYVRVVALTDGNIIFGGDTLTIDNTLLTDNQNKREVTVNYIKSFPNFENCFSLLDSSKLIVNLSDAPRVGILTFFCVDTNKVTIEYGKIDTFALSQIGISRIDTGCIRYIPDSIPGGIIKISDIQRIVTHEENQGGLAKLHILIIGIAILILVAIGVWVFIRRKPNVADCVLSAFKRMFAMLGKRNSDISQSSNMGPSEEHVEKDAHVEEIENSSCSSTLSYEDQVRSLQKTLKKQEEECIRLRRELVSTQEKLSKTEDKVQKLEENLKEEKKNRDQVIERKISGIKSECQQHEERIKEDAEKKIRSERERADKAEAKSRSISDDLQRKFKIERDQLLDEKKKINDSLQETKEKLATTTKKLTIETESHVATKHEVERLTAETNAFKDRIVGVTSSRAYCEKIHNLIILSEEIQSKAYDMLQSDLSDPYFAYKALALFTSKLNAINLHNFYTDVELISKTGFVIKGTPLASYDQNQTAKELENLTKTYFFTTYLKSYVDALVVLNESLIGMQYLIGDVKPSHINAFESFRKQLNELLFALGINVLTVKVFDTVGVNIDLLATEIDAGYDKHGAILEIENCKVSLIGGSPDPQRIIVKIQK